MIDVVKNVICDKCSLIIYKPEDCKDGSCCIKAEKYGIKAVQSVVIDGKIAVVGKTTEDEIRNALELRK